MSEELDQPSTPALVIWAMRRLAGLTIMALVAPLLWGLGGAMRALHQEPPTLWFSLSLAVTYLGGWLSFAPHRLQNGKAP